MLKLVFALSVLLLCDSISRCQTSAPKGWGEIEADGLFTFYLPQGFKKTDMMGVENYLGEYLKGETRFLFVHGDTGSHAYDVRRTKEMNNYDEVETTVDGKKANIRTFYLIERRNRTYVAECNIGDWANANVELFMEVTGRSPAVLAMAKQIFRSVDFPQAHAPPNKRLRLTATSMPLNGELAAPLLKGQLSPVDAQERVVDYSNKFDEFSGSNWESAMAHLDAFALDMQNNPHMMAKEKSRLSRRARQAVRADVQSA